MFKANQLPFIGYKPMVKKIKKDFDKDGHGYPLEIKVKDGYGRLLMQQTFKNVWDRKSKPEIMTDGDWSAPITVEYQVGPAEVSEMLDEVECAPPDNSVQQDLSEYFEV